MHVKSVQRKLALRSHVDAAVLTVERGFEYKKTGENEKIEKYLTTTPHINLDDLP